MELRDTTLEPSHIHVPRPSRSETPVDQAALTLDADRQRRLCEPAQDGCDA
jgi:hypothetical protein